MDQSGHNSMTEAARDKLVKLIESIERLEEEKKEVADQIKEVYSEAKAFGYDTKVLRKIIARRKRDKHELEEEELLMGVYEAAIAKKLGELV